MDDKQAYKAHKVAGPSVSDFKLLRRQTFRGPLSISDIDESQFAQHLTVQAFAIYSRIQVSQYMVLIMTTFADQRIAFRVDRARLDWPKVQKEVQEYRVFGTSLLLVLLYRLTMEQIDHYNEVSQWVTSMILTQTRIRSRISILNYFIRVAFVSTVWYYYIACN